MYRDPKWGKLEIYGALAIVVAVLWFAIPPSAFIKFRSMAVTKSEDGAWMMSSVRETPIATFAMSSPAGAPLRWLGLHHVVATWKAEFRVVGREDGISCYGGGEAIYSPVEGNAIRYQIGPWATACLDAGPPTSVIFDRQVWLFGLIPLRNSTYAFTINPENAPVIAEPNQ